MFAALIRFGPCRLGHAGLGIACVPPPRRSRRAPPNIARVLGPAETRLLADVFGVNPESLDG